MHTHPAHVDADARRHYILRARGMQRLRERLFRSVVFTQVICDTCSGSGTTNPNANTECGVCGGSGVRLVTRQIGPGMLQQMQTVCNECRGEGSVVKDKVHISRVCSPHFIATGLERSFLQDRCKACAGKKVSQERKILEVPIDKGMKHNQKIVFAGEADEAPGTVPGDVIFVLQMQEHARFIRQGDNLLYRKSVKLVEALCGCQFVVEHLDGRKLLIKTEPTDMIKPGDIKGVHDEGMPIHKRPYDKGTLYIAFDVEFPAPGSLSVDACALLEKHLPPRDVVTVPADAEESIARHVEPVWPSVRTAQDLHLSSPPVNRPHPCARQVSLICRER